MPPCTVILAGDPAPLCAGLAAALTGAGYSIRRGGPADVLLNLDAEADPDGIIARCERFAAEAPSGGAILTLINAGADWRATHRLSCLSAFTRHFALHWAPSRIRLNAICIGAEGPVAWNAAMHDSGAVPSAPATPREIAGVVLAILGFPSMTGQLIRLGA